MEEALESSLAQIKSQIMARNFKKLLGGVQKAKILHYTVINTLF